jgi:hypothetical protein
MKSSGTPPTFPSPSTRTLTGVTLVNFGLAMESMRSAGQRFSSRCVAEARVRSSSSPLLVREQSREQAGQGLSVLGRERSE